MSERLIRSSLIVLSFLLVLSLPAIRAGANDPFPQSTLENVDSYLHSEMQALKIPGLETAIVYKDQVVYANGFGVADPSGRAVSAQTPMLLGSLSKGFTALAVMQLVEAGKVELDAPVRTYLPWFRMADSVKDVPAEAWARITLRQLLNQSSGIPEYAGANTWTSRDAGSQALEKQIRSLENFHLVHIPGSVFEYSNANYEILGMIVQSVSGQPYEMYIREHIFTPLEMTHSQALASQASGLATGYRFWFGQPAAATNMPVPRAHAPSAFLVSNAEEMGYYLIAQMNDGHFGRTQVLSSQGIAELHRPAITAWNDSSYAMGWVVDQDGSLSHNGETPSFSSSIRIEGDWGVFVVRNIAANQRGQRMDGIASGILNILQGQMPDQVTPNSSFRRTMLELLVLLLLLIGGMLWSLRRLQTWKKPPDKIPDRQAPTIIGPSVLLLINLALAMLLLYMGPISNHRSFAVLAASAPDQILLLGTNIILALAGAALQGLVILRGRSTARYLAAHPGWKQGA